MSIFMMDYLAPNVSIPVRISYTLSAFYIAFNTYNILIINYLIKQKEKKFHLCFIISEVEKLGDYILNVAQAVVEKKI